MREYLPPHQLFKDCFNALHSEWRPWCNSKVHALRVVAAEGLSLASVTRYLASPGASGVARAVMSSLVAPQTVGANWPRQKVAWSKTAMWEDPPHMI
jgi:hypothetical protein